MPDPQAFLDRLFAAALAAVTADNRLPPHLPEPPPGRTVVVGAGKGAGAMARAVEAHWAGPLSGLVVTRYGHGAPTWRIEVVEAAHPTPDAAGANAAVRILALARALGPGDLLLCLISGGGSALLAAPAAGVSLDDKRAVTRALLRSGAPIADINRVRKHLSAIKGGRWAAATAARVVTLAVSDVAGDDPSVIASGPTVADPTTLAEARAVLSRYGIEPPPPVAAALSDPANETPKPGDPRLARAEFRLIATARHALDAAAARARAEGAEPVVLGDAIEGEARDVAETMAEMAREIARTGPRPAVLLSGGETTVTVRGGGRGGRNAEFLLALAIALDGLPGVHAIACDTDGIDGTEHAAGARIGPGTLARARALGHDPLADLAANDAFSFFEALGDLIVTGPTRTNVNDFRAILIGGPAPD
jgi:glycerate 2-kinase